MKAKAKVKVEGGEIGRYKFGLLGGFLGYEIDFFLFWILKFMLGGWVDVRRYYWGWLPVVLLHSGSVFWPEICLVLT